MHYFNDRSQGIFVDGYVDRDGSPVGDVFVYLMRAKLVGVAGRDWTRDQNAALASSYSSDEMAALMAPSNVCLRSVEGRVAVQNGERGIYWPATNHTDVYEANGFCFPRIKDGAAELVFSPQEVINMVTRNVPGASTGCALTLHHGKDGDLFFAMWRAPVCAENTHYLLVRETSVDRLEAHWRGFVESAVAAEAPSDVSCSRERMR